MIKYSAEDGFIKPVGLNFQNEEEANAKIPHVAIGVFSKHLYDDIVEKFIHVKLADS